MVFGIRKFWDVAIYSINLHQRPAIHLACLSQADHRDYQVHNDQWYRKGSKWIGLELLNHVFVHKPQSIIILLQAIKIANCQFHRNETSPVSTGVRRVLRCFHRIFPRLQSLSFGQQGKIRAYSPLYSLGFKKTIRTSILSTFLLQLSSHKTKP